MVGTIPYWENFVAIQRLLQPHCSVVCQVLVVNPDLTLILVQLDLDCSAASVSTEQVGLRHGYGVKELQQ